MLGTCSVHLIFGNPHEPRLPMLLEIGPRLPELTSLIADMITQRELKGSILVVNTFANIL